MKKVPVRLKTEKKGMKPLFKTVVSKLKKITMRRPAISTKPSITKLNKTVKKIELTAQSACVAAAEVQQKPKVQYHYNLPHKYKDDRITLLPRDPWWLHAYWDISENRINEVIFSIQENDRRNPRWVLRVYDVTGVDNFNGNNAQSFYDIDINYDSGSWYLNVNQPERSWCVEIGFITISGKYYMIARSNVIKTPYFGVSSIIDEEWAIADEDYYRLFGGTIDFGKSSMERRQKFEEFLKKQVSSQVSSWGQSSLFSERPRQEKDKFFLEVWTELILHGRTHADADVTVEGKKVQLRDDGTFALRYSLPVGDYQYAVQAISNNKKHKRQAIPAAKRFDKIKPPVD